MNILMAASLSVWTDIVMTQRNRVKLGNAIILMIQL